MSDLLNASTLSASDGLSASPLPSLPVSYADAMWYWCVLPFVALELLFWLLAGGFAVCDFYLPLSSLSQQKLQPSRLSPSTGRVNSERYGAAARLAIRNQLCGSLPTMLLFAHLYWWRQMPVHAPLPPLPVLAWQAAVLLVVEELLFYYTHRLWHLPALYSRVHYIHHEWTAPVALTACSCHFVEHVVTNISPMLVGPLLSGCHYWLYLGWLTLGVVNTVFVHSGYNWPLLAAEKHDRHHSVSDAQHAASAVRDDAGSHSPRPCSLSALSVPLSVPLSCLLQMNKCQFGAVGLLDWLHGTRYEDLFDSGKRRKE